MADCVITTRTSAPCFLSSLTNSADLYVPVDGHTCDCRKRPIMARRVEFFYSKKLIK
jgi:hypothetical protein